MADMTEEVERSKGSHGPMKRVNVSNFQVPVLPCDTGNSSSDTYINNEKKLVGSIKCCLTCRLRFSFRFSSPTSPGESA